MTDAWSAWMNRITLVALEAFPQQLEAHYAAISLVHDLCSHEQQHLAGL